MTSKNWYFKLMREDLKRRIWLIALISLILFFSFPVIAMLFTTMTDYSYDAYYNLYQVQMEGLVSLENVWMPVFLCVAVVVTACSSFSYLNSKSKVDFYHSLPIRREKLFLVNYIDGYLIMAVLYAFFLLLAILIGSINGASAGMLFRLGIEAYFVNMSFFFILYATVTTALMMTGHQIVGLLGAGVFYFYIPLTSALLEGFCSTWLLTYYSNDSLINRGMLLSPFIQYIMVFESADPSKAAGIALLFGLLITLCALWLYKRRPSEGAGKSLVFAASKPVIRIAITITSGMAGAMFGWSIKGGMGWTLFFLICGAVIAHCVIEIIYHADFRKLFSHRLQLLGCIVGGITMVLVFRYDVIGYDRYLPKANSIESISIDIARLDSWVEYGTALEAYEQYQSWNWVDRTEYLFENMEVTETEAVIAVIELAGRGAEDALKARKQMSAYSRYYYPSVYIKYRLTNGRTVTRSYELVLEDNEKAIERIYGSDEFKYGMYPLLKESQGISYVRYEQSGKSMDLCRTDLVKARQFLVAYQQDLLEQTIADRKQENPVAVLRFVLESEQKLIYDIRAINNIESVDEYKWKEDALLSRNFYPVYPSFKRTVACLKEAGVEPEDPLWGRDLASIEMEIRPSYLYELTKDPVWLEHNDNVYEPFDINAAVLKKMTSQMYPMRYSNYNLFLSLEDRVEIKINVTDEESSEELYYDQRGYSGDGLSYAFPFDKVPELINQEIMENLDDAF